MRIQKSNANFGAGCPDRFINIKLDLWIPQTQQSKFFFNRDTKMHHRRVWQENSFFTLHLNAHICRYVLVFILYSKYVKVLIICLIIAVMFGNSKPLTQNLTDLLLHLMHMTWRHAPLGVTSIVWWYMFVEERVPETRVSGTRS